MKICEAMANIAMKSLNLSISIQLGMLNFHTPDTWIVKCLLHINSIGAFNTFKC